MSQKKVMNALVFVIALLIGAIVVQSIRRNQPREDRRSTAIAPDYRPQLSPDVFARALEQSPVPAQSKNSSAPTRSASESNSEETRQLTASR